jgi:predicted nucleotidyltransferase
LANQSLRVTNTERVYLITAIDKSCRESSLSGPRHTHQNAEATAMIPRSSIQAFAAAIAREFQPQRIILFGSHARGEAGPDSDVDLLVVIPQNGKTRYEQAFEIRQKVRAGFPLDLLVRTPQEVEERMGMND